MNRSHQAASADTLQIQRDPTRAGWILKAEQWFPVPLEKVFEFFSDASNLETLTPPWVKFQILTPLPIEMRTGTLIDYRLRVHGLPLKWRSEISVWEPLSRFVDEQRQGPYRYWHHDHCFTREGEGTLVKDMVHYGVPGGRLIHTLFVAPDLRRIFGFRQQKLREMFG